MITLINFAAGLGLDSVKEVRTRKLVTVLAVGLSLLVLCWFKYLSWLVALVNDLSRFTHLEFHFDTASAALPVGISFYTFQALSYTLDVYNRRIGTTKSLRDFACFVAFFPQLVAGPIVRGREFLPQIPEHQPLRQENTVRGIELMLCGYLKKCVVGDNLALIVDQVFGAPQFQSGSMLWFGALCFTVQIYCDFSGYTDIARGLGKIAGFDLPVNFKWPYLSTSIRDFWRRWHITLSFWMRDYVYIPLGGRESTTARFIINLLITWLLCGLWHGAGANFIFWGLYHGVLITVGHLAEKTRLGRIWARMPMMIRIGWTFFLVAMGWVLFRADGLSKAAYIYKRMFTWDSEFILGIFSIPLPIAGIGLAMIVHIISYHFRYDINEQSLLIKLPTAIRITAVALIALIILIFSGKQEAFIYFAF